MTLPAGLEHILSPARIGQVELRNRVVRTSYGTHLGRGQLNDDLIAHHEARARGGVALSMLEATGIHASGPMTLNGWDDSIIPRYALLADRVHAQGMKVFGQLNHLGLAGSAKGERPWSASAVVSTGGQRAVSMSREQIDEMVQSFAQGARRTREGGLDGVEIHCAHGHLIQQFLSPATNLRDDDYGGDWSARTRFVLEIVTRCRAAVGPDFVLGVRVGPEPDRMRISVADCARLVRELEHLKLIDYVSISQGSFYVPDKIIGAMHEPAGYELEQSRQIASSTALPTIVTGRIRTLTEADRIVKEGIATLVGMTRAHIADPDLVEKTSTGRAGEVRPCIACNQGCVGGLDRGRIGCTVNARAGRELSFLEADRPAPVFKRVIVVGGGPAGMEAARIAALRGHNVTLFEAEARLGGALQVARRAPSHELIGDIADWLSDQMRTLSVDVHLGVRADAATISTLAPDIVIAAGGAPSPRSYRSFSIAGDGTIIAPALFTARELLARSEPLSVGHAVVIDELGSYEAIGAAERLQERGAHVTFVTPFSRFAPKLESALVTQPALKRLRHGGLQLLTGASLLRIGEAHCVVGWQEGGASIRIDADLIATAGPGMPDEALVRALQASGVHVVTIGEARSPGSTLENAIREGHDVAMRVGV